MIQIIKSYYYLTKPGIIYGNLFTAAAGFFLAAKGTIDMLLLLSTLLGTGFIIASACVFNNYMDRNIDKKMERTQKRALVTGKITGSHALFFGSIVGLIGISLLFFYTNTLTAIVGLVGFIFYVFIYGYAKRTSDSGTLVGTIPGATPPVAGYLAVTNQLDMAALLLFLILVCWQMPHFYAIAIYRIKEYAAAGIPVLPITKGVHTTKIHILFFAILYFCSLVLLSILGYTGYVFLIVMGVLACFWIVICIKGFWEEDSYTWAKKVFHISLLQLPVFSLMLALQVVLP